MNMSPPKPKHTHTHTHTQMLLEYAYDTSTRLTHGLWRQEHPADAIEFPYAVLKVGGEGGRGRGRGGGDGEGGRGGGGGLARSVTASPPRTHHHPTLPPCYTPTFLPLALLSHSRP